MSNNNSHSSSESFLDKGKRIGKEKNIQRKVVKKKDKEAFLQAYDMYVDEIFRFVYFKVNNREQARDITSQVFLKTWNHLRENKLEDKKTLRALIYTIARNTIIDHYRSSRMQKVDIDDEDEPLDIQDQQRNPAEQVEVDSDMEMVREKMKELKDEYREILLMRYINELSFPEIARITGRSKNNARVICHRAMKALQDLMNE